jgi:hypothetical protein
MGMRRARAARRTLSSAEAQPGATNLGDDQYGVVAEPRNVGPKSKFFSSRLGQFRYCSPLANPSLFVILPMMISTCSRVI